MTARRSRCCKAGQTSPPNFVSTGKRYLTLAQTFKLLATALKSHAERGAFPTTMQTDMTYGPIGVWSEIAQGVEQEIDAQAVIAAAARINFGAERKQGSSEPPSNRVPLNVTADGKMMHAAQFLRLMAEVYQSLRAGKTPSALRVRSSNILPPMALPWQRAHRAYADTPAAYGYLPLWTVKPTQFKEAMGEKPKAESRNEATGDAPMMGNKAAVIGVKRGDEQKPQRRQERENESEPMDNMGAGWSARFGDDGDG